MKFEAGAAPSDEHRSRARREQAGEADDAAERSATRENAEHESSDRRDERDGRASLPDDCNYWVEK